MRPVAADASITITWESGKADLTASYCTVDADGAVSLVGTDTSSGGKPVPARSFTAEQVGGRFLLVKLDGGGGAGKKYQYKIHLTGKMLQ